MIMKISNTSAQPTRFTLTKDDVFGHVNPEDYSRIDEGLVVARSEQPCPVFGDIVPYKSETVVCRADQEQEVRYWLSYVNGGNCVSDRKVLKDGRIALRGNYMCW